LKFSHHGVRLTFLWAIDKTNARKTGKGLDCLDADRKYSKDIALVFRFSGTPTPLISEFVATTAASFSSFAKHLVFTFYQPLVLAVF